MIDLPAMAARDDLKANAYFGQHSSAAVISCTTGPVALVTRWTWNITSITRDNVGIYTFNFKPFDYTGTTYPLFVYATVGAVVGNGAAGLKLFATYSIVNQTQIKVYTWLHDGTATELVTTSASIYDTLSVLIVGRRNRPTTDGTSVINPAASLLNAGYNLGVTGL